MGRGSEQTFFFHRKYTDSQQIHEKFFNIANHQENANQNHNEVSPNTYQNGYYQKDKSIGEDVEKREPWFTVGGNVNWYATKENSMEIAKS